MRSRCVQNKKTITITRQPHNHTCKCDGLLPTHALNILTSDSWFRVCGCMVVILFRIIRWQHFVFVAACNFRRKHSSRRVHKHCTTRTPQSELLLFQASYNICTYTAHANAKKSKHQKWVDDSNMRSTSAVFAYMGRTKMCDGRSSLEFFSLCVLLCSDAVWALLCSCAARRSEQIIDSEANIRASHQRHVLLNDTRAIYAVYIVCVCMYSC